MKRSLEKWLAWQERSRKKAMEKARTSVRKRINARNDARRDREWHRAYHSLERVTWVQTRICKVHGCRNLAINAHVKSGGKSRKAGYRWIADICEEHHGEQHNIGWPAFEQKYRFYRFQVASDLQADWERHLEEKEELAA